MTEEISNTGVETTADVVTETTETISGETEQKHDRSTKTINDRIGKAMDEAKAKQPELQALKEKLAAEANIETLQDVNLPDGTHKGINYNKVISDLPEDAQKLLANIRSSYTKKTQELAAQRKEMQAQIEAMREAQVYEKVSEVAERNTQLDPYDTETFNARIEEEVARRMKQMLEPMQQQYELQQRKQKLDQWTSEHPDYIDYKQDIVSLLKQKPSLDLQSAYYIVKGKSQVAKQQELEQELKAHRETARQYGYKVSAGNTQTANKPPKGLKGYQLYQWIQNNKGVK
tara:strand:- start:3564 stop:4427 length:864 start_codon:yes stop_codon:yes gene_type:complete